MSPVDALWVVFLKLRAQLVAFAGEYLPEEVATAFAGESIAHVFGLAVEGTSTAYGPYAEAFHHLLHKLNTFFPLWQREDFAVERWAIPEPDPEWSDDLARAFGALFDAAFEANLSRNDVVLIKSLIACGAPPVMAEATLIEILTVQGRDLEPLRRAFWAIEGHESDATAVCKLSGRLAKIEETRGRRWLLMKQREKVLN